MTCVECTKIIRRNELINFYIYVYVFYCFMLYTKIDFLQNDQLY